MEFGVLSHRFFLKDFHVLKAKLKEQGIRVLGAKPEETFSRIDILKGGLIF